MDRTGKLLILLIIILFLLSLLGVFIVSRISRVQPIGSNPNNTCVQKLILIRGVYVNEINESCIMNITMLNRCPVNLTITRIMLDNNTLSNTTIVIPPYGFIALKYNVTSIYDNTTTHRITVRYYWDQNYYRDEFYYISPGNKS